MARQDSALLQPDRNAGVTDAALTPRATGHSLSAWSSRNRLRSIVTSRPSASVTDVSRRSPASPADAASSGATTARGGTSQAEETVTHEAVSWPAPSGRTTEASPRPSAEPEDRVPRPRAASSARRAEPRGIGSAGARDPLAREVKLVGALLGQVIVEQEDEPLFELVEQLRRTAIRRRASDDHSPLDAAPVLADRPLDELLAVARAFTAYFLLINLAEEKHRVRTLRKRERAGVLPESIAEALTQLDRSGLTTAGLRELLDRLLLRPVLTAHPTEARRRLLCSRTSKMRWSGAFRSSAVAASRSATSRSPRCSATPRPTTSAPARTRTRRSG